MSNATEEPRSLMQGSYQETALIGVATPIRRLPFIPAASYRVFSGFFP